MRPNLKLDEGQVALLGTVPDRVLAEQWGVNLQQVTWARQYRGIDAYLIRKSREWQARAQALFGALSDKDIAKQVGTSTRRITLYRENLGIPASAKEL